MDTLDPELGMWTRDELIQQGSSYFIECRFEALESLVLRLGSSAKHNGGVSLDEAHAHVSFEVCFLDLHHYNATLALSLVYYPLFMLGVMDTSLLLAQQHVCRSRVFLSSTATTTAGSMANPHRRPMPWPNAHVRLVAIPPTLGAVCKSSIGDIRADDTRHMVQFMGTVVRTGSVRMLEKSKKYECQKSNCRHQFFVHADPEQGNALPKPLVCPQPRCRQANSLREVEGQRVCVDYQEIKVQDQMERIAFGSMPRSIAVILQCDLADKVNAGDDVVVVGTLINQWQPVKSGRRLEVDIAVSAISIRRCKLGDRISRGNVEREQRFTDFWANSGQHPLALRDIIVKSVCPQLFGMYMVKLALLLTLVGGTDTSSVPGSGVRRRSQSHILLVGDPGCGKSQLLRFAALIAPRGVLTTGIGSTGAGLTCTAVRESGSSEWSIEAGALVLANEGVCCIDEFASIREADRATIHEAMEQQTLSVAKAGLVVTLNTRTSVIACCNPKGSYDVTQDLTANTAIASPLLSRFDLIFVLIDRPDKNWDTHVSQFLLQQAVGGGAGVVSGGTNVAAAAAAAAATTNPSSTSSITWDVETLRQYVSFVRYHFQPRMLPGTQTLLQTYYLLLRRDAPPDLEAGRTTVRLLESLVRLSEAHAKLMFRSTVELEDAVVAISLMTAAQALPSLLDFSRASALHSEFPSDPAAFYEAQERDVLCKLHTTRERLEEEGLGGTRDNLGGAVAATATALSSRGDESAAVRSSAHSAAPHAPIHSSVLDSASSSHWQPPPQAWTETNGGEMFSSKKRSFPFFDVSENDGENDFKARHPGPLPPPTALFSFESEQIGSSEPPREVQLPPQRQEQALLPPKPDVSSMIFSGNLGAVDEEW